MTREEIMRTAKPILFNTEMVRAILDGRKTATRRVIKPQPIHGGGFWELGGAGWSDSIKTVHPVPCHSLYNRMPYRPGDILYVRETWNKCGNGYRWKEEWEEYGIADITKWRPSIHMPKEAARIFLRVTDVRIERLQDITEEQAEAEGGIDNRSYIYSPDNEYNNTHTAKEHFAQIWNNTIKKSDLDRYGWGANSWVWVIEFERVRVDDSTD